MILMVGKIFVYLARLLAVVLVILLIIFGLPRLITELVFQANRYTLENVPGQRVAIVFGAGLQRSGMPSAVLRDRVETAARLYLNGKVEKILMSGDNRFVDYNEPGAMKEYAVDLGVPEEDIVLDFAGRRTYDTCYRAHQIFGLTEAVLVTQSFHLPRALFTCNNLGVKAVGVPGDVRHYSRRSYTYWNFRELLATTVALWEVWVAHPLPVLGKPENIFSTPEPTQIPLNGSLTSHMLLLPSPSASPKSQFLWVSAGLRASQTPETPMVPKNFAHRRGLTIKNNRS
jgi:SanA protein